MFVLKATRYKNKLVSYQRIHPFRSNIVLFANKKTGNFIFLTIFNNIYRTYQVVTNPVPNGTYKIKVTLVDTQNEDTGTQGTVVVAYIPLPPNNVSATLAGNTVTLVWQASVDPTPDFYIVYGNNGSGDIIDRTAPIATLAGNILTMTFVVANGSWSFVVESRKNGLESVSLMLSSLTVPIASIVPPKPGPSGSSPLAVTGLLLNAVSVGAVNISFLYLYGALADTFNIYSDNGTGVINYATPAFTLSRQNQLIQSYTTPQIRFIEGPTIFQFVVRASIAGNEEKNTDVYSISVDGTVPANPVGLVLDTVF